MPYAIFDLDNTISDDGWRINEIDWSKDHPFERYHRYHLLAGFDAFGNQDLVRNLPEGTEIVVFTARPEFYAPITQEWLERNKIDCAALLMRPTDDHAHSVELKQRQLRKFFELMDAEPSDVLCAYDDRQDVVQMYRDHNIKGYHTCIHNVCAYTNPRKIR